MSDLTQIFLTKQTDLRKKERKIPTLFNSQKKAESIISSTHAFNKQQVQKTLDFKAMNFLQKSNNQELYNCRIGQDLKKSISRYSMQEELKIYQRRYILQLIVKSSIIALLIVASFVVGLIPFKVFIEIILFLVFFIPYRQNLLTNSVLSSYLSNKTPWLIQIFNFWFLVCSCSLVCGMYHDFTLFIMGKLGQEYLVSSYLVFNFAVFNTLCYVILYFYLPILSQLALIKSANALQSGYFKNSRYAISYLFQMIFGIRHIKLVILLQVAFYLLLCSWALFHSFSLLISEIFNIYFLFSQMVTFASVFLIILVIILLIDYPIWYFYKLKVSKIHLFISLFKLQSIPKNDYIHCRCLRLLQTTVKESYSFMDNQINNSIYYRNYWDIFEQFLKDYLHRTCVELCNLEQKIKNYQNILKSTKTLLQNPFIPLKKWYALMQLQISTLIVVNMMQPALKIYSIILYRKSQAYNSNFELNVSVKNSLNQIFNRISDFRNSYSQYLSQATQSGLQNHSQQLQIFLQNTNLKRQVRRFSAKSQKRQ